MSFLLRGTQCPRGTGDQAAVLHEKRGPEEGPGGRASRLGGAAHHSVDRRGLPGQVACQPRGCRKDGGACLCVHDRRPKGTSPVILIPDPGDQLRKEPGDNFGRRWVDEGRGATPSATTCKGSVKHRSGHAATHCAARARTAVAKRDTDATSSASPTMTCPRNLEPFIPGRRLGL